MSQRPRRYTSSRSMGSQKRKSTSEEEVEDEHSPFSLSKNWFFQQTPNSQVYYIKVIVGLITGLVGIFYGFQIVAGNWFIFPTIALGAVYVFVRFYLKYDQDTVKDLPLVFWHGTISLYIGFICTSALFYMIINPPHFTP